MDANRSQSNSIDGGGFVQSANYPTGCPLYSNHSLMNPLNPLQETYIRNVSGSVTRDSVLGYDVGGVNSISHFESYQQPPRPNDFDSASSTHFHSPPLSPTHSRLSNPFLSPHNNYFANNQRPYSGHSTANDCIPTSTKTEGCEPSSAELYNPNALITRSSPLSSGQSYGTRYMHAASIHPAGFPVTGRHIDTVDNFTFRSSQSGVLGSFPSSQITTSQDACQMPINSDVTGCVPVGPYSGDVAPYSPRMSTPVTQGNVRFLQQPSQSQNPNGVTGGEFSGTPLFNESTENNSQSKFCALNNISQYTSNACTTTGSLFDGNSTSADGHPLSGCSIPDQRATVFPQNPSNTNPPHLSGKAIPFNNQLSSLGPVSDTSVPQYWNALPNNSYSGFLSDQPTSAAHFGSAPPNLTYQSDCQISSVDSTNTPNTHLYNGSEQHLPASQSFRHFPPSSSVDVRLQQPASSTLADDEQSSSTFTGGSFIDSELRNGITDSTFPPILPRPAVSSCNEVSVVIRGKSKALSREAKNERRRQQRLFKKQAQADLTSNTSASIPSITDESSDQLKKTSQARGRKPKNKLQISEQLSSADSNVLSSVISSEEPASALSNSPVKPQKRRISALPEFSDHPRKIKPKESISLESSENPDDKLKISTETEALTKDTEKQLTRIRPPRPKKKRPLPTLIRKKKRCAFYGEDTDSEPDISVRLGNRSSDAKNVTDDDEKKRRSERTAGDRKKYTVDLELNLSDDDSDANEELATMNPDTGMVENNGFKVVEYVLGRRTTKRVIRKAKPATDHDPAEVVAEEEEEEVEEDVEEFYLKYKGYSHLHCEWRALDEIEDPRIGPKLRRFEQKQANLIKQDDDDVVLFNPDYVEVERVLDMKVYRDGQLVTANRATRDANLDPEVRKQRRRERERNRARMLRAANKAKLAATRSKSLLNEEESDCYTFVPEEASTSEATSTAASENAALELDILPESVTPVRRGSTSETIGSLDRISEHASIASHDGNVSDSSNVEQPVDESTTVNESAVSSPAESTILDGEEKVSNAVSEIKNSGSDSEGAGGEHTPTTVTYYLVKWRSLPYEDATWELAQDVDPAKVKEFLKWRNPPKVPPVPRDSQYKIIRPDPSVWCPIESDRMFKNNNKLRDYQLEGVNWLTYCWFHHRNCILADEMGLGKTVQSVAFLMEIAKAGVCGPFLIIVPLSTIANWQRELENWSDLNVVVYHGSSTSRRMIQEYEIFYRRRPSNPAVRHDVYKFHVLVTTFEVLMTDITFFGRIHWVAGIIDEAHRLKNKKCKLSEGLRYLDLDHRVLLTGTPLQNNVEELFGLLNFLEPERFNCSTSFVAEYGDLKTEEQVENLKNLLKPMMLRRLKEDVEKSLAPKEETIVEVELTNIQKKYYRAIMERNFTFLCKGSTYSNAPNLMNVMMELRKCCNHPFLIKGAEDAILDEMRTQQDPDQPLSEDQHTFQALVNASGKLVLIHKLLPKLKADGHKVLIFSQMIRVLDIIEDYLIHQRFQFERIDGRIHGPLRQEAIDRFTVDPDKFVFLLCTKAGGLGINLTAADVVIIYDSDWNPQNDLQAQARCHRIGQQKMVKVYRLITRNTYEREMFDRASLKLGLDRAVLQSMGSKEARQAQMSKKEIEELLKKGAYGALMDDDKAGEEFCEEDIDKILQSRSRVVQLEQGEKNSTFSKATFSMSNNRSDIALDDPNFWQKWAKMAGVDESAGTLKELIMKTPRQRRQTSRYTALPMTESAARSSPNYEASEHDDSTTAQSSGDENSPSTSGTRGRRNHRKHHYPSVSFPMSEESAHTGSLSARLVEPLDRADVFRVERCLLTWPWGQWERGLASIPFKRPITAPELAYFATAILAFSLRFMPPSADSRVRATVLTLSRPLVWNLTIHEAAKAVFRATARASRGCTFVDPLELDQFKCKTSQETPKPKPEAHSAQSDGESSPPPTPVISTEGSKTDTDLVTLPPTTTPEVSTTKQALDKSEPEEPADQTFNADEEPSTKQEEDTTLDDSKKCDFSPKTASFDPSYLVPYDSFRKHMHRHSPRLFNRVALLFFLQCEIVGIERTTELMAGRLNHTEFEELANSLPPMDAIDSEPPVPWWDSCCDKCLLLGILKHGWEKYAAMRLDPGLCFYGRAQARLKELESENVVESTNDTSPPDNETHSVVDEPAATPSRNDVDHSARHIQPKSPKQEPDDEVDKAEDDDGAMGEDETHTMDPVLVNSLLTALPFPAVADVNSRARKIVAYFARIKNQSEFDAFRRMPLEDDEDATASALPHARFLENRILKWTRREEADFYRVVSSFGVEFTPVPPKQDESPADVSSAPVKRRYKWHNFRRLSNINRKSDLSLTEYFQSFYRMCQRVCKRPLTEFAGPATTAATATTSGSAALGEEVPIEPISEERANRCLSRIDLLVRIRNEILPHPHLEERLQLCQRSSENPSWWIPGKHDGELLRAAAKHGLARTDLNMLPDPEFSFHQFVNACREKDNAADSNALDGKTCDDTKENDATSMARSTPADKSTDGTLLDGESNNCEEMTKSSTLDAETEKSRSSSTAATVSQPSIKPTGTPANEWSVKYPMPLPNVWPKDRTIQHRLELVCQTIENNEWPVPKRCMVTAGFMLSDPNRSTNDGNLLNLSAGSCTGSRHPGVSSSMPISLPVPGNLQSPYDLIRAIGGSKHWLKSSRSSDQIMDQMASGSMHADAEYLKMSQDDDPSLQHPGHTAVSPSREEGSSPLTYTSGSPNSTPRLAEVGYKRRTRGMYRNVSSSGSPLSSPTPRGRGRGRGRGTRGTRGLTSRGRTNIVSPMRFFSDTPSKPDHFEHISAHFEACESADQSDASMLPPTTGPHRNSSRGRKRRLDSMIHSATDLSTKRRDGVSTKRDRIDSSAGDFASRGESTDTWDVRVPVISLVDGSLIYGEQAPKRRVLEQWLESHPNYMPYSVEVEDRIIYNRVASSRGQDTNNMEALAYKHYLNSLIMNATASLQQQNTTSKSATQLLQLQQQQQLLQAFGAYARHPAYASLLSSALNSWPGTMGTTETEGVTSSDSSTKPSSSAHLQSSTSCSHSATNTVSTAASSSATVQPSCSSSQVMNLTSVESALSAAYKQASANLAYFCNPLAAAYGQMMLSAGATDVSGLGNLSSQQQATLALYANCMLAAKQQQQATNLDQQRQKQQLATLAAAIAAACSGSGPLDASSLLSMFAQSQPVSSPSTSCEQSTTIVTPPSPSTVVSKHSSVGDHHPNTDITSPVNFSAASSKDNSRLPGDDSTRQEPDGDPNQSVLDLSK